jgi:hypothetical protein
LIATVYEANAGRTLPERQSIVTATKMKRSNTCRLNSTVQSDRALSKSKLSFSEDARLKIAHFAYCAGTRSAGAHENVRLMFEGERMPNRE